MEITPEMYLDTSSPQITENLDTQVVDEARHNRMGAGLERRAQLQHNLQGVADDDLDSGNFNPQQAEAENLLNEAIAKAAQANTPSDRAKWSAEAERLAGALVGYQQGQEIKVDDPEKHITARQELENSGYNVDGVLEHAGTVLDDGAIEEWDAMVKSTDKTLAKDSVVMLRALQNQPEHYVLDKEDFTPIPESLGHEISKEFGDDVAHVLETTSLAVANGLASLSELFQMYRNDSKVLTAFATLLNRGTIQFPLFGVKKGGID